METHSCILAWRLPMERGASWATVHGVAESNMTERLSMHSCTSIFEIKDELLEFWETHMSSLITDIYIKLMFLYYLL